MRLRTILASFVTVGLVAGSVSSFGQKCIFESGGEGSIRKALESFHNGMRELVHGPAENGDFSAVRSSASGLSDLKRGILESSLPPDLTGRCEEISAAAVELAAAVDHLVECAAGDSDKAVGEALDSVHSAFRNLNGSLTNLGDMLNAFHDLLHPLWHEAYPDRDVAAIRTAVPRLKMRSAAIVSTAERREPGRVDAAKRLQASVIELERAAASADDAALLDALRIVHDHYEQLAEGGR